MSGAMMQSGPPYASTEAGVGGLPTVGVDVPISAVFIALFIIAAVGHMVTFQKNRRAGHKFLFSGMMFGFCMARISANVLRIVWATRQHNVRLAIAANVFVNAGILLIYIVNLIFAQRMLRAAHPTIGWNKALRIIFRVAYVVIVLALMVIAAMPLFILPLIWIIPRRASIDKFGKPGSFPVEFRNRWRTQALVLLIGTCIVVLEAGFRTGTGWMPPRPISNPAWYHAKWCFYFFNYTLEIIVIYFYLIVRVDMRFHVPDGASEHKNYAAATEANLRKAADVESGTPVSDGARSVDAVHESKNKIMSQSSTNY